MLPAIEILKQGGHTRLYADEQMQRELQMDDAGRLTGDLACSVTLAPCVRNTTEINSGQTL